MNYCHLTQNHGDDFLTSLWQMVYKFISPSCEKQRGTSSRKNYIVAWLEPNSAEEKFILAQDDPE